MTKMFFQCLAIVLGLLHGAPCVKVSFTKRNNVCSSFEDYSNKETNPNCWYNPDVTASVPEMILRRKYPLEKYEVVTKDGYILTVFRIPKENSKGIVFLQHPLTAASNVWVDKQNSSLAFILYDAGYDVWMGNFRGTIYSRKHTYLSPDSNAYWNHSFHEMAVYDLPAQIDLVRHSTRKKKKIVYVGHSMGTTAAFIYSALLPSHAEENVKVVFQLAPTGFLSNTKSPIKNFNFLSDNIQRFCENLRMMDILAHNGLIHNFLKGFCFYGTNLDTCLKVAVYMGFGPNFDNVKVDWIPIAISQNFAGFSIKIIVHYLQQIGANRFQQFDYGKSKNILHYGIEEPALYPITNITIPQYFVYGGNDWLAVPEDVEAFYDLLPDKAKIYGKLFLKNFNHYDAVYGKNVKEVVYNHIVDLLESVIK